MNFGLKRSRKNGCKSHTEAWFGQKCKHFKSTKLNMHCNRQTRNRSRGETNRKIQEHFSETIH